MRQCGVLMPVFSLPGSYGIGSLGQPARDFIDFLRQARQSCWQLLPVGPTGYGDSPYQSFCAFAGNPYFIDLDLLVAEQLLTQDEADTACATPDAPIDYAWLYETRFLLLRKAVARLDSADEAFRDFCAEQAWWLDDYAMFMSIKDRQGGVAWQLWPDELRTRDEAALLRVRQELSEDFCFWQGTQFLFYRQWDAMRDYAHQKGISIIGDIPIYVSPDSSDIWASPALFQMDKERRFTHVAGVPPDGFSAVGQMWGNPLYDWAYHEKTDFAWWGVRLRHAARVYDVTRIDHFRGFAGYFSIPADGMPADGKWETGPGTAFIDSIRRQLPELSIIAEDLGYLTPDVIALLRHSGFPGMKILQFAFDSREASDYMPHNYDKNSVVYTGTHDNTTTTDWEFSAPPEDVALAREYLDIPKERVFTESLIRAALASVSDLAVIPLADWLGLGKEARINTPSTLGGNWVWRVDARSLDQTLEAHMAKLCALYGRAQK